MRFGSAFRFSTTASEQRRYAYLGNPLRNTYDPARNLGGFLMA
jgi:hypothetical protein